LGNFDMREHRPTPPIDFATAVPYEFPKNEDRRVTRVARTDYPPRGIGALGADLGRVVRVLAAARTHPALLLESKGGLIYPDVVAAALLGLLPADRRPKSVLVGSMWQPNDGLRGRLERLILRLADRAVDRYAVQSSEELTVFPQLWGVEPSKMRLNLHFYYPQDVEHLAARVITEDFIFSGGDSLRNYAPLVEAARRFPAQRFILRTRQLDGMADLPANVVVGRVPKAQYFDEMRAAKAVVVPMAPDLRRAAGQQTYLGAMFLAKPTIVSASFGVRDHVTDGVDGLIVSGTTQSYVEALGWLLDEANAPAVERMREDARTTARTFHYDAHARRILAIIDELFAEDVGAPGPAPARAPQERHRDAVRDAPSL
jgi:glycosyltransferase involved in cell wall biosynthesis